MPLSLFPMSIRAANAARAVYVCRESKDAFVSWWHFATKLVGGENNTDLESSLSMFVRGLSPYRPFWEHCLEYWRQSVTRPNKILFLKYENMIAEPVKHVKRMAMCLGVLFSAKEEEDRVPEKVVRLCSFDKLSGLPANQSGQTICTRNMVLERSVFFRKGKVGDWANRMTQDMGRKIDRVTEEKLNGSGLVL
ncbi:hypothetical protein BS78_03G412300 [Paspalum vaginatum]|nr:hypothetical protein BS78_03G412300 [Paspalum vaginatum]